MLKQTFKLSIILTTGKATEEPTTNVIYFIHCAIRNLNIVSRSCGIYRSR